MEQPIIENPPEPVAGLKTPPRSWLIPVVGLIHVLLGVMGVVSTYRYLEQNWLQIHFMVFMIPLGIGILYRFDICRRLTRAVNYIIAVILVTFSLAAILGSMVFDLPFQASGITTSSTVLLLIFLALAGAAWWSARVLGAKRDAFWKESRLFRQCCVIAFIAFTLLSAITGGTLITYNQSSLSSGYSSSGFQNRRLAEAGFTIPAVVKFQYSDGIDFVIVTRFSTQVRENSFSYENELSHVTTLDRPFPDDAILVDVKIREKGQRAFYERNAQVETQCHIRGVGRYSSLSLDVSGEHQMKRSGIIDHAGHIRSLRAQIRSSVMRQIMREAVPKFKK
ncbi:MAG: hypothetical protein ACRC8S_03050 [Fimbriiglobus sp.]